MEEVPNFFNVQAKMKYQIFLVNCFLRNEKKIDLFGFLEKKAYGVGYHGSLIFAV